MSFQDKMKNRLYLAIAYIVCGITLIVVFNVMEKANEFLSVFGLILVVLGLARLRRYFAITKNEETMKTQQIRETDERNLSIMNRAKSCAFNILVILLAVAIIVLNFMEYTAYMQLLSGVLCALLVIYWVSYFIIRGRS